MKKILLLVSFSILISCSVSPKYVYENWEERLVNRNGAHEIEGKIHTSSRRDEKDFLYVTVSNETGRDLVYKAMNGNLPWPYVKKNIDGKYVASSSLRCGTGYSDFVLKNGESRELLIGKPEQRGWHQYIVFQDTKNKLYYKVVSVE